MVSVLDEPTRRANGWVRGLGAAGVGVLVILSGVEGIGRVALDLHFAGLAAVTGAWITAYAFLLLADTTAHGRIIRATRLETWLVLRSRTADAAGRVAADIASAAILAFTSYACATGAVAIWRAPQQFSDPAEPSEFVASALAVTAIGAALAAILHLRRLLEELWHLSPSAVGREAQTHAYLQAGSWIVGLAVVVWAGSRLITDHAEWSTVTVAGLALVLLALLVSGLQVAIVMVLFFPVVAGLDPEPNAVRVFLLGTEAAIVPILILLALAFKASGLIADLADSARWIFRRRGTGAGLVALWGNAFSGAMTALTDDHAARAAARDIPSMIAAGFWPRSAVGVVAAGAALGSILPPSLLVALYAMDSHTGAFAAAATASAILLCALSFVVASPASLRGNAVAGAPPRALSTKRIAGRLVRALAVPAVALAAVFSERFTLAEAGALGVVAALAIGVAGRKVGPRDLWPLLVETGRLSVPILFLLVAGGVYAWLLTATGIVQFATVAAASPGAVVIGFAALVALVVLLRGLGLGPISMLMLLFPLWLPLMKVVSTSVAPDVFGVALLLLVQASVMLIPGDGFVRAVRRALGDHDLTRAQVAGAAVPFATVAIIGGGMMVALAWAGGWGI